MDKTVADTDDGDILAMAYDFGGSLLKKVIVV